MKNSIAAMMMALFGFGIVSAALADDPTPAPTQQPGRAMKEMEEFNQNMKTMGEAYEDYEKTGNEASRQKASAAAGEMLITMTIAMHVTPVMIGLCGLTGGKADEVLARDKKMQADTLVSLDDDASKKKFTDGMADIEVKLNAAWEKRSPEVQARECEGVKKHIKQ